MHGRATSADCSLISRRALGASAAGWLLSAAASSAFGSAAPAGLEGAGQTVALPNTHDFSLRSSAGLDYRVMVAVPAGEAPTQGYRLLVMLDGNAYFPVAAQALRMLRAFPAVDTPAQRLSPLLVVGVGYPGDAALHGGRRTWDFLPPPRDPASSDTQRARLRAEPGGAAAFLNFLVDQLRPALQARYPVRPDGHVLAGHSLGGYFALHALVQRPQAFQRYAAISPSLWWDGERLVDEMAQAQLQRARVLLAVASEEMPSSTERSTAMLNGARRMRTVLAERGLPAQALEYLEVERENHLSMPFALMPSVLRFAAVSQGAA